MNTVFEREIKDQNYTVMSNYHLRDKNLSLKAKGLLSLMLSLSLAYLFTSFLYDFSTNMNYFK